MSDVPAPPPPKPLSPSRLNDFLGCEHRTYLDLLHERGELDGAEQRPVDAQLLAERGERHEQEFLAKLVADGRDVVAIEKRGSYVDRAAATEDAMRAGREVIHQAAFLHDGWVGFADFLIRVVEPSDLGDFSYEVHDAKLARHAKPEYVFQLLFYTQQVARIQGRRPERMHLVLGDGEAPPFAPEDFDAYAAQVVAHYRERRDELAAGAPPSYPYPVASCGFCPWWKHCADRRREEDHLSLVAMLQRRQGLRLETEGVHTVGQVAALPPDATVPRLAHDTLTGLRRQARLQVASRGTERPLHELLEPEAGRGFARLPQPSPGDVFFDFEGDPYWGRDGLQYLFGTGWWEYGEWRYRALWAESEDEERANFEQWMRWVSARLEAHPDMHVFHYNHYEKTTLRDLMGRYGVCEDLVDDLLRRTVLVDLYAVVRQAMRIGTESYGLKAIEPVFGFERTGEVEGATGSLRSWQDYLDTGDRSKLAGIEAYNENDCRSTAALRDWLYEQRTAAERQFGVKIDELPVKTYEPKPAALEWQARVDAARARLDGIPGTEMLRELLDYHRREARPQWWAYFARTEMSPEQIRAEDSEAIGGLFPAPGLERVPVRRSWRIPLAFPPQDFKIGPGKAVDPDTEKAVTVVDVDEARRIVWIERGRQSKEPLPTGLIPGGPYGTQDQQEALVTLAERVGAEGALRLDAPADLLLRRPPRLAAGTPPPAGGPVVLDRLRQQVAGLQDSVLMIQGPPGSGKTWTGARLAVDMMRRGKRVGVVATAHKAIINLLREVDAAADEEHFEFRGLKKSSGDDEDSRYDSARITSIDDRGDFLTAAGDPDIRLLAGTAWLWAFEGMRGAVDVLFVDEAGQVSLADALAVAQGARSVVLLGDPQQLAHVSQGTHPEGAGASVLEHLLAGRNTVPRDFGVLLDESWRMHPDVCRFVSDTMYDGLLTPRAGCEAQRVDSPGLSGAGLRMLHVDHEDCRQKAPEEADAIAAEMARLLDGGTYVDRDGVRHDLTLDDILVVAPYNAQVRCLRAKLPPGARLGTVDKFQGQEAPVLFFSMTSSSGEDVPRGMDFLFSRNRLNVAVSRAQAMAVVVCSPKLLWAQTSTVEQMRLVNMLCRFAAAVSRPEQ